MEKLFPRLMKTGGGGLGCRKGQWFLCNLLP